MPKLISLWLQGDCHAFLTPDIAIALPSCLIKDKKGVAKRIEDLGYNALVCGAHDTIDLTRPSFDLSILKSVQETCKESGLQLIIKLHPLSSKISPFDPEFRSTVQQAIDLLPNLKAIFWESSLFHPDFDQYPTARDATTFDLLLSEMRSLEAALNGRVRLFYQVSIHENSPKQHARWLTQLSEEAGKDTLLAFSPFNGKPWHDFLPLHPFWVHHRYLERQPSVTPIAPLVNLGLIGNGEGLWSNVPFDLFEHCRALSPQEGAIILANQLPGYGGILECSLWMGAQTLLSEQSPLHLAEKWLKWRRGDLNFDAWIKLMRKGRSISMELNELENHKRGSLSHEVYRFHIESVIAQLKFEQSYYENLERHARFELPTLSDYCQAFVWEARNKLSKIAQSLNVSLVGQGFTEEKTSFWNSQSGIKILSENSFSINKTV